jgi:D-aminopeptidase
MNDWKPGPRNLLSDVEGLWVGNAHDQRLRSGATVVLGRRPFTAAVHVAGGAPGTRETDLLAPDKLVQEVDALVLSGGSAFGLDAASGVADALRAEGRGFAVGDQTVPIVPAAILFDLTNGGEKDWVENPYRQLGRMALGAVGPDFALGSSGAGYGASTATLRGGLGSASLVLPGGITVAALVAVNALGEVTVGEGPHFWAAPFEINGEFGGRGSAPRYDPCRPPKVKQARAGEATTIAIVATDARLSQAQAQRMAVAAHDGLARAIMPAHTPMDGDLVFAAATGQREPVPGPQDTLAIGHAAALCLTRAVARGIYLAAPSADEPGLPPSWQERFA